MTMRSRLFYGGILGIVVGAVIYAGTGVVGVAAGLIVYIVLWHIFERLPG